MLTRRANLETRALRANSRASGRLLRTGAAILAAGLALASSLHPAFGEDPIFPGAIPTEIGAVCDGSRLTGTVTTEMTSFPGSLPVEATVALEYASGEAWLGLPGGTAVYSAVVQGSSSWTFPFAISLAGLPSNVTSVRAVAGVSYPDIIGGQTVITREWLVGPAATCAAAPDPNDSGSPWTLRYTVRLGDTLTSIGNRYGLTPSVIGSANGITAEAQLVVGQSLVIPAPPTPVVPSSIGLGSPASNISTPRPSATPKDTATPKVTETPTPTATGTPASPTPTATRAAVGAGAVAPGSAEATDEPTPPAGGNPLAFLEGTLIFAVVGVVGVVFMVGLFFAFRIWRDRRGEAGYGDEAEAAIRPVRAQEPVAATAVAAPAAAPVAAPAPKEEEEEQADDDDDESPLPSSLRDVFVRPERRSMFGDVASDDPTPRAAEMLNDAEQLIQALRRRRAG